VQWTTKRKLFLGYCLAAFFILASASSARWAQIRAQSTQEAIARTFGMLRDLEHLIAYVREVTVVQRAYIISGDERAIASIPALRKDGDEVAAKVKAAIGSDSVLTASFQDYLECVRLRRAFVNNLNKVRKEQGFAAAQAIENTGEDDHLLDRMQRDFDLMKATALVQLHAEETANRDLQRRVALTELLTVLLTLALLTGMTATLTAVVIENRRLYADLIHRVEYDNLIDIPNRYYLRQRMEMLIEKATLRGSIFALIFIDLDRFKEVNDTYGHCTGDLYLQLVAQRMKNQLRAGDILARVGGDEFAVLATSISDRTGAEEIVHRLERCFETPIHIGEHDISGSASMGLAIFPEDAVDDEGLHCAADKAMYAIKNERHHEAERQQAPYGLEM
jgi:diguanylate cyclase (GGDEF)-like protein